MKFVWSVKLWTKRDWIRNKDIECELEVECCETSGNKLKGAMCWECQMKGFPKRAMSYILLAEVWECRGQDGQTGTGNKSNPRDIKATKIFKTTEIRYFMKTKFKVLNCCVRCHISNNAASRVKNLRSINFLSFQLCTSLIISSSALKCLEVIKNKYNIYCYQDLIPIIHFKYV